VCGLVRGYVFTEREKKILRTFVDSGVKLNGFEVLVHHLKKAKPALESDLQLAKSALEKLEDNKQ
jgi:hypothetical protein